MKDFELSPLEIEELRSAHRQARTKREAYRINAVILLGTGWTRAAVSQALLLDPKTLDHYLKRYRENGVVGLVECHYQGAQPELTPEQLQQLDEHLCKTTYLRAADIVQYVKEEFGVEYSISGMTDLLHRLKFVYKKPKPVPSKADPEAQKKFLEQYEKLKKSKGKDDPIYFADGVHPQHNPVAACGWIKRGEDKPLLTNSGRQRLNINGAIELEHFTGVFRDEPTINGDATIALFGELESRHPKAESIYVICDNASYYHSEPVQVYSKTSRIKIVPLPTYSPNLNLIERLWKYFRETVLYNEYYERFAQFREACLEFFANLHLHADALRSRLTENFQIIGQ